MSIQLHFLRRERLKKMSQGKGYLGLEPETLFGADRQSVVVLMC